MTWWMLALPGLLVGLGLAGLISTLAPKRVNVTAALERLGTTTVAPQQFDASSASTVVGSWVARRLPENVPGFRVPREDLALIGMTEHSFLYRKAVGSAFAVLATLLGALLVQLLFPVFPFWIWLVVAVALGLFGWVSADIEVRNKARRYRSEFTAAMADYLGLVAAELSDGTTPPAQAMGNAAQIANSWVFIRIRQELTLAEYSGESSWEALNRLAAEIKVPALEDAARIMRLAGEGALVSESLRGASEALRGAIVSQAHSEANAQSVKMGPPMALTIFVLSGLFITPAFMSIFMPS